MSNAFDRALKTIPDKEMALEPYLQGFVQGGFTQSQLKANPDSKFLCFNTSVGGSNDGAWTRPDLTLVCLHPLQIQKSVDVEIISFELKSCLAQDANHKAVMEAISHTRFSHYSYVAWHACDHNREAAQMRIISELTQSCTDNGIGLILFKKHADVRTYKIAISSKRFTPPPVDVERFLKNRLSSKNYAELQKVSADLCQPFKTKDLIADL